MKRQCDIVFWLALQRVLHDQPLIANQLLELYGSPKEIFQNLKSADMSPRILSQARDAPLIKLENIAELKTFDEWDACENDLEYCVSEGIELITYNDRQYPQLLKEIADPPIILMVKGDAGLLNGPCISIVGARKATPHGKEVAFEIARELAKNGIVVVSGMAYGIDAASHLGAIETGKTIAVWGSGIDCCYPPVFRDLSERIVRSGCVISEFPLGTPPFKQNFPQRNRIISGLSAGTVIVEAASRSGSLITAKFALEQGREVFAVPGPAGGTMSEGTHTLLRNGATFVENAEDVIVAIAPQLTFVSNDNKGGQT